MVAVAVSVVVQVVTQEEWGAVGGDGNGEGVGGSGGRR